MTRGILFIFLVASTLWGQVPAIAIHSSRHYRESSIGNATGRSGSATMTVRALLDRTGATTIEATTGALDSTTVPPGTIAKVQLKPLSAAGDAQFAQNLFSTAVGGYFSFSTQQLHRGQQFQLQANINGIDRNRTDVVTVIETTKLRPNLALQNLSFPASGFVNQPVNVAATIVELNGDTPATTNCVLDVDGTEVDEVNNVYVDAGGSVSCAFTYRFAATGTHTVKVTAGNVLPADWDVTDNSASSTISVVDEATAEGNGESFQDWNQSKYEWTSSHLTTSALGTIEDAFETTKNPYHTQSSIAAFSSSGCAGATNAAAFSFPVNVAYMEMMDAEVVRTLVLTVNGLSSSSAASVNVCAGTAAVVLQQSGLSYTDDHWLYLTSSQYYDQSAKPLYLFQQLTVHRYAGDVTYWSQRYQCEWWYNNNDYCANASDYYTWNSSSRTVYSPLIPVGETWSATGTTQDALGKRFSGALHVTLSTNHYQDIQPLTCTNSADTNGYTYQDCSGYVSDYTVTSGYSSQ